MTTETAGVATAIGRPALDWGNFNGLTLHPEWKPDDQELIYHAIIFRDGNYGDADEDAGEQIVERLLQAWRDAETSFHIVNAHRHELLADVYQCPVCAEIIKGDDICAKDVELGTCHAACLEGSPVVNLDTGEPVPDGELATFRYGDGGTPSAPNDDGDGSAGIVEIPELERYADGATYAAAHAAWAVFDLIRDFQEVPDVVFQRCELLAFGEDGRAANQIAGFVRKIGRDRATPAAIGQQLKLLGHVDQGDLDPLEELVVGTFVRTLCDIDAYLTAEDARAEALMRRSVEHPPVPIEDTTMELVDDAMETWG